MTLREISTATRPQAFVFIGRVAMLMGVYLCKDMQIKTLGFQLRRDADIVDVFPPQRTKKAAEVAREAGVKMIAIGIGKNK